MAENIPSSQIVLANGISLLNGYIKYYPIFKKVEIVGIYKRTVAEDTENFSLLTLPDRLKPNLNIEYSPMCILWTGTKSIIRASITIGGKTVIINPAEIGNFTDIHINFTYFI